MVRFLAIAHIVIGLLLISFGIADGVTTLRGRNYVFWTGYGFFGVWIGTWVSSEGSRGQRFRAYLKKKITKKHLRQTDEFIEIVKRAKLQGNRTYQTRK